MTEDGQADPAAASALDGLGRPVRLAHEDGTLVASLSTDAVRAWLADDAPAVTARPEEAAVADALDTQDVVSAVLLRPVPADPGALLGAVGSPADLERLAASLEEQVVPEPFDLVGMGWAVGDDGTAQVTLAYHFPDESTAAQAVESVEAVWTDGTLLVTGQPTSELLVVDEVTVEGQVVVVRSRSAEGARAGGVFRLAIAGELPFVSVSGG